MENHINTPRAGYHMLQILYAADGKLDARKDLIIRNYLANEIPFYIDLDYETEILSCLSPEDYPSHFSKAMEDFSLDSTPEERKRFLNYAVQLVTADREVTNQEDNYLHELFMNWDPEHEE